MRPTSNVPEAVQYRSCCVILSKTIRMLVQSLMLLKQPLKAHQKETEQQPDNCNNSILLLADSNAIRQNATDKMGSLHCEALVPLQQRDRSVADCTRVQEMN
jgi:hypothetical protein